MATIFPPYDFARQIAKDKADITMLLPPGSESHSYEPTPQDIIKIQNCDIFIYVGGESDTWVNEIFKSIDTKNIKVISLMDVVDPVEEEPVEGMQTEDEHSGANAEYDEHVWTSPKNAIKISQKISDVLCEVDAENSAEYKKNCSEYLSSLTVLDNDFTNLVKSAKRKVMVFGDRFPFRYFVDAYGLSYYAAFPGCSSETEPSAANDSVSYKQGKTREHPGRVLYRDVKRQNSRYHLRKHRG